MTYEIELSYDDNEVGTVDSDTLPVVGAVWETEPDGTVWVISAVTDSATGADYDVTVTIQ